MSAIRCTMAQAVVKYLGNQFTEIDGTRVPLFPGVYGIFGHGNVTCLAEALEAVKDTLPTWRGQNEQSMALAGIAFAKAAKRRQIMVVTSSRASTSRCLNCNSHKTSTTLRCGPIAKIDSLSRSRARKARWMPSATERGHRRGCQFF